MTYKTASRILILRKSEFLSKKIGQFATRVSGNLSGVGTVGGSAGQGMLVPHNTLLSVAVESEVVVAAVMPVVTGAFGALGWAFVKMLQSPKTKWMGFVDLSLLTYYE